MNDYLILKWLHILSSTLLFGTGIGSAFYLLVATLRKDPQVVAAVARCVVLADWLFTATTVVFQPASGFYMVHLAGYPMSARWLAWSVALYIVAVACWLPVVWLQTRLRDVAAESARQGQALSPAYYRLFGYWVALGVPAFFAFVAVFYLMTAKPA
jgi:uncharacterized membrane protein